MIRRHAGYCRTRPERKNTDAVPMGLPRRGPEEAAFRTVGSWSLLLTFQHAAFDSGAPAWHAEDLGVESENRARRKGGGWLGRFQARGRQRSMARFFAAILRAVATPALEFGPDFLVAPPRQIPGDPPREQKPVCGGPGMRQSSLPELGKLAPSAARAHSSEALE